MEQRKKTAVPRTSGNGEINGWSMIAGYLKKRNRKQKDLAEYLRVTPAAISQARHGKLRFSPAQLQKICTFLDIREGDFRNFYATIFCQRMDLPPELQTLFPIPPQGGCVMEKSGDQG